ncbi:Apolipoprotein(a) (Fragment) [Seminavis robusta]|uniref:Apolipoprotein(A) n=1 Tax=Seminavis robusta TaxID=568900 RepID=A0A9N8DA55_9STRA
MDKSDANANGNGGTAIVTRTRAQTTESATAGDGTVGVGVPTDETTDETTLKGSSVMSSVSSVSTGTGTGTGTGDNDKEKEKLVEAASGVLVPGSRSAVPVPVDAQLLDLKAKRTGTGTNNSNTGITNVVAKLSVEQVEHAEVGANAVTERKPLEKENTSVHGMPPDYSQNTTSAAVPFDASPFPEYIPEPTGLRRSDPNRPVYQPGAVAVFPLGDITDIHLYTDDDTNTLPSSSSDSTSQHMSSTDLASGQDVLLNATLVQPEESTGDHATLAITPTHEVVEAKPALEGFRAIVANKKFKFVCLGFIIMLLAVVIPVALREPDTIPLDSTKCGTRESNQADYRGTIARTEANEQCQRWNSQDPHTHNYYDDLFSDAGLDENYCRNPGGDARPWCYTTNPVSRWGWCDVPFCDGKPYVEPQEECGTLTIRQEDYRGKINITATGKICQRWDSMEPHFHDRTPDRFPNAGLESHNHCRNPDGSSSAWCFTLDNQTRREPCDVTPCGIRKTLRHHNKTCEGNCTVYDCGTESLRQTDYRGTINVTASGRTCQRWDSQAPHAHGKTPTQFPELEENYCRNPDGNTASIWCHTTDPNKWTDLCEVPYCSESVSMRRTCGTLALNQNDYRGGMGTTVSGFECVAWLKNPDAIAQGFTPEEMHDEGLFGAYCRNPGSERSRAWCFVDNPNATNSWEYCDVSDCKECGSPSLKKSDYRGTKSSSRSGKNCLQWVSKANELAAMNLTMDYMVLEENFCRNLDGMRDGAWCFVAGNSSSSWEYCNLPDCEELPQLPQADPHVCGSLHLHQADYTGNISTTVSGLECQQWSSMEPHPHKYNPDEKPELEENYCRNPDGPNSLGAWCFTQSTEVLWEYCRVPPCFTKDSSSTCGTLLLKQQDYRGSINRTSQGIPCQRWDSQFPHRHKFAPETSMFDLEENYCRNPDGSDRAWCFSSDPTILWSYCDVPTCD